MDLLIITFIPNAGEITPPSPVQGSLEQYLILVLLGEDPALPQHHPHSKQRHQNAVPKISEHHSKQKGEGDDGVRSYKGARGKDRRLRKARGPTCLIPVYSLRPTWDAYSCRLHE